MNTTTTPTEQNEPQPPDPSKQTWFMRKLSHWKDKWAQRRVQAEHKKRAKEVTKTERSLFREAWWLMSEEYNAIPSKLKPDEKVFYETSLKLAIPNVLIPFVGAGIFTGLLVQSILWAAFPKELSFITKKRIRNYTGLCYYGWKLWSDMCVKALLEMKGSPWSDTFYVKLTEKCPQSILIAYYPRYISDDFEPINAKPTRMLSLIQGSEESRRRKNIRAPTEHELNYAQLIKENMKKDMDSNPELFWALYGTKQQQLEEQKRRELEPPYEFDPEIEVVDDTLWDDSEEFTNVPTRNTRERYHRKLLSAKPQKVIQYEKQQEEILKEILEEEERVRKEAEQKKPLLPTDQSYRNRQRAILEYLERKKRGDVPTN